MLGQSLLTCLCRADWLQEMLLICVWTEGTNMPFQHGSLSSTLLELTTVSTML